MMPVMKVPSDNPWYCKAFSQQLLDMEEVLTAHGYSELANQLGNLAKKVKHGIANTQDGKSVTPGDLIYCINFRGKIGSTIAKNVWKQLPDLWFSTPEKALEAVDLKEE